MWTLRPEERLHEWRVFRNRLTGLELEDALTKTVHLWSFAPYVTHYLAADLIDEWPDPWTLVHENYYCDLAKALGMLYTLYLSSHWTQTINHLEIQICKSGRTGDTHNTVWVNRGKYILNFSFNEIVNKQLVDQELVVKHRYSIQDLKLNLR